MSSSFAYLLDTQRLELGVRLYTMADGPRRSPRESEDDEDDEGNRARRRAQSRSDRQVTDDAVSVAAPISARGEVVAALSIVVRGSSPAAVRPMAPGVRAAARAIGRTLAGGPAEG